jgi:hypothetical protein
VSDLARSNPSSLSSDWLFEENLSKKIFNVLKREAEEVCGLNGAGRQILVEDTPSINTYKDFSLLDI